MRLRGLACGAFVCFAGLIATAQPRPIFDPDDFVEPRQHEGPIFISRLLAGGARNYIDDFRPLHDDVAFIHLTNTLYFARFQFAYKHSEAQGEHDPKIYKCPCTPPIYFPTPAPPDATPAAPRPGPKETLQFGWYDIPLGGSAEPRNTRRYRVSWSRQRIDTVIRSFETGRIDSRRSGHEQSFAVDADTHLRIFGHDVVGWLLVSHTARSGTIDNRRQTDLLYMSRFPGLALGPIVFRATLTVGGVTGRGASGLNVVNPAFEAFWHEPRTRANLHVIWSPQSMRSGADGWETHHQIAVFIDRALYVKLFSKR
jgi:hypothetical protein